MSGAGLPWSSQWRWALDLHTDRVLVADDGLAYGTKNSMIPVELTGIEDEHTVKLAAIQVDSRQLDPPRVDVSAREPVGFGPKESSVEGALARAIEGAVSAGRWDVVAVLAKELEARRLAAVGVMHLTDERANGAAPR
jgi:hypothetical protein